MNLKKVSFCFISLAIISGMIACGNDKPKTEPAAPADQLSRTSSQVPAAEQFAAGSGKVVQKMDASRYTYICLDDGAGNETWAAVPQAQLEIGEQITLKGGTVMRNFNSKALNRTFDSIIFATDFIRGAGDKGVQMQAASMPGSGVPRSGMPPHGLPSPSSGGSDRATVPFTDIKVEKSTAKNGYTVSELFEKAASLNGQKVTVKGLVVKVNANIMGRNWIHIQDGTGDPAKSTHDLVVTSADIAEKGAIISVEGILAADKDFGSGYRYDVIVEDATLVK